MFLTPLAQTDEFDVPSLPAWVTRRHTASPPAGRNSSTSRTAWCPPRIHGPAWAGTICGRIRKTGMGEHLPETQRLTCPFQRTAVGLLPLPQPIFLYNDLDGLTIRSITLSNKINEYGLNGDPITLTGDIWDGGRHSFQGNRINFDVALTPAPHNLSCLGGDLIFGGAYGSSGAISLSKWGAGRSGTRWGGYHRLWGLCGADDHLRGNFGGIPPLRQRGDRDGGATWLSDDLNTGIDSIGSLAGEAASCWGGFSDNIITHVLFTGIDDTSTAFSGLMSGTGTLFKEGTGSSPSDRPLRGRWAASTTRISVGEIQVDAGTLQLGVTDVIAPTCAVTVNAGPVLARARLDLNGHSDAIGSLSGVGPSPWAAAAFLQATTTPRPPSAVSSAAQAAFTRKARARSLSPRAPIQG